jgi:hypothetical protein
MGFFATVVFITAFIIAVIVIAICFVDFLVDVLDISLPLKVSPPGVMAERRGNLKLCGIKLIAVDSPFKHSYQANGNVPIK